MGWRLQSKTWQKTSEPMLFLHSEELKVEELWEGRENRYWKELKQPVPVFLSFSVCTESVRPRGAFFFFFFFFLAARVEFTFWLIYIYISCLLLLCLGLLVSVKRMPRSSCCSVLQLLLVPHTRPNLMWHFKSKQCDLWSFFWLHSIRWRFERKMLCRRIWLHDGEDSKVSGRLTSEHNAETTAERLIERK